MPSNSLTHAAGVLATAMLVSIVTAGAAIAASGIGHMISARTSPTACNGQHCTVHQARSAHAAKASAAIAMRGYRAR